MLRHRETSLSIEVAGYEYPSVVNERFDANWLFVRVRGTDERGSWDHKDPCLLTWEARELVQWLQSLADGGEPETSLDFMEPELSFSYTRGQTRSLTVNLRHGLRPNWASQRDDYSFTFPVDRVRLKALISGLSESIGRFPERTTPK